MNQVTSLPLNAKVLTEEQKTILLNTALQTLYWISPILNPKLGQVEPAAEFKRDGMLAYADGTNWNPSSGGKGNYRYDIATASWVKTESITYMGEAFELDAYGDLMPVTGTVDDTYFELDGSGDLMPKA